MKLRRSSVLALAAGVLVLSACGDSAPPAAELADEMIDTLEVEGVPVSDAVKACMKDELANFELTEQEQADGFSSLQEVTDIAADADAGGQQRAKEILARFEAALASCNAAG